MAGSTGEGEAKAGQVHVFTSDPAVGTDLSRHNGEVEVLSYYPNFTPGEDGYLVKSLESGITFACWWFELWPTNSTA